MKTTRYFDEQVRRKRPYIELTWCVQIVVAPIHREEQPNGRIRFWGKVVQPGQVRPRYLRVVTLADGETIHNAFFDRRFREEDHP